jgi:hypothetical protein
MLLCVARLKVCALCAKFCQRNNPDSAALDPGYELKKILPEFIPSLVEGVEMTKRVACALTSFARFVPSW